MHAGIIFWGGSCECACKEKYRTGRGFLVRLNRRLARRVRGLNMSWEPRRGNATRCTPQLVAVLPKFVACLPYWSVDTY